MQHFVPLLSGISEDIKEDQQVSSEAILGTGKRVPTWSIRERSTTRNN